MYGYIILFLLLIIFLKWGHSFIRVKMLIKKQKCEEYVKALKKEIKTI